MERLKKFDAKWSVLVDDVVVPMPQRRVKVRVIRAQANVPDGFVLVRDHNSPHDVILNDDQEIDLADGNVVYRLAACDVQPRPGCDAPAKLAFFVDDRWEVTIQPNQKAKSLRELFDIPDGVELLRDFESPIDDPIEEGERIDFKDGPVFITRKVESREITIIVRGRPRKVSGCIISFDEVVALAYNPVRTEPFIVYTVSYSRGPKANPEGDLFRGQTVKIKEGMVFCVTETDKS